MNEQFRVAHKLGLMFRPETPLPDDVKNWAISQLKAKSPALGISQIGTKVKPWPKSLQPDLMARDTMFANWFQRRRLGDASNASNAERQANRKENLMKEKDELKFSHRNVYGKDQVRLRFASFWANHFTTGDIHDNTNHIGHALDEAILANLNGDFSHMLYKVTSHPAMLIYLDNIFSAGPNSNEVKWAKQNGEQAGLNDNLGRELLELHTVSTQHFVSDNPSQSDIDYIANTWRKSNGNLDQIHSAVIERAVASKEPKFQWPMTWLFQVIRLSDASFFKGWDQIDVYDKKLMDTREIYEELGQSFWHTRQPNGYPSSKSEWLSGEMFERRIRFADAIYTAGKPAFSPQQIMSRIGANKATQDLVNSVAGRKEQFIALMCSPELMGLENA